MPGIRPRSVLQGLDHGHRSAQRHDGAPASSKVTNSRIAPLLEDDTRALRLESTEIRCHDAGDEARPFGQFSTIASA